MFPVVNGAAANSWFRTVPQTPALVEMSKKFPLAQAKGNFLS